VDPQLRLNILPRLRHDTEVSVGSHTAVPPRPGVGK